jgi:hypothetical protein
MMLSWNTVRGRARGSRACGRAAFRAEWLQMQDEAAKPGGAPPHALQRDHRPLLNGNKTSSNTSWTF